MADARSKFKELWAQRKKDKQSEMKADPLQEQLERHKRQKVEALAKQIPVSLPSSNTQLSDSKRQNEEARKRLLMAGFFDEVNGQDATSTSNAEDESDDDEARAAASMPPPPPLAKPAPSASKLVPPNPSPTSPPGIPSSSSTNSGRDKPSPMSPGPQTKAQKSDDENDENDDEADDMGANVPAGSRRAVAQQQQHQKTKVKSLTSKGAAIPEGFFDDQKKDIHARDAAKEVQARMKEELLKFQQEVSDSVEAAIEKDQKDAEVWNMEREMTECLEMAKAHEWLEGVRVTLEEVQRRRNAAAIGSSSSVVPSSDPKQTSAPGPPDDDDNSEIEENDADENSWRAKRVSQKARTPASSAAQQQLQLRQRLRKGIVASLAAMETHLSKDLQQYGDEDSEDEKAATGGDSKKLESKP